MKEKNKILFLLHLPPPVHGSSIVGQLIKNSKSINETFKTHYVNLLVSRSVDESGKTKVSKLFRFFGSWFKVLLELIKNKPDLCYFALTTTGNAFYKDVAIIFLLRLFRVKTVIHLHNKGIKKNKSNKINHSLYRYVFKKSNVILLSKYLYDDIDAFVAEDSVYICHNGVEDICKVSNEDVDEKSDEIKILFLSNLIKSKGVFVLFDACRILLDRGCVFTCDFVGGEGDINAHQFQIEAEQKGIAEIAKYLGEKYSKDKESQFRSSDIFVLPTFNDCFPLVLLEAMQYKLPIVSTEEGGIRDIVENGVTGFLVEQNNSLELANKLEVLLKNETIRLQMGQAGREKYEREFTLQSFETKIQEILEQLLL